MSRTKSDPFPLPSVGTRGNLTCSCGNEHVRTSTSPPWNEKGKRRRYECPNRACRRSWYTIERFETYNEETLPPVSGDHQSGAEVLPTSAQQSLELAQMPPLLVFFVSGAEFPDNEVRAKIGVSGIKLYVEHTDQGPDGSPGWLLSGNGVAAGPVDWVLINQLWIGVRRDNKTEQQPQSVVTLDTRPARRPKRRPSRAIARMYQLIERELREEIAEKLLQVA